jgi:RNA 2',3'-cyclic 3'-phosphodiesterase
MRLFIAIELPEDVKEHLRSVQDVVRGKSKKKKVKWTPTRKMHITLKFLGNVPEGEVPAISDELRKIETSGGSITLLANQFRFFPQRGMVRIVGAALTGQVDRLMDLQSRIDATCQNLGFESDRKAFHPHITLARARQKLPKRSRKRFPRLTQANWPGGEFVVDRFVLMESRPKSDGGQYLVLANFPLSS